ncbi:RHS repeat-associated core domain-containing protein [Empedobacter brevis]|uniref:RHS repeat-associated core domain-containing protein n=1 Tax=Empedobacter brevis TaxID=247 RepID=UPI0035E465D9
MQDEFGLGWYDYQRRNYDPAIGRWFNIDAASELSRRYSPYTYALNNPVYFIDPDFATPPGDYYDTDGNKIGTDGINDQKKYIVTNKDDIKSIKKANNKGGTTQLSDVSSASLLPSNSVLKESLAVLDRTDSNGGKKEESSLVMKDGTVVKGETGPEVKFGTDEYASAKLPSLPDGKTITDVEASIHSHPTASEVVGEKIYSSSALDPSTNDKNTFKQFGTNIIVGRLGLSEGTTSPNPTTGKMETSISSPSKGIGIYNGDSTKPIQLKVKAVQKILGK